MLNFFNKNNKTRFLFFLLSDILLISISVVFAFFIRFEGNVPSQYEGFVERMIILAVVFTIPIFYISKLYNFSWAYVGTVELVSLFKATTLSFIIFSITLYISKYFPFFINFPRSILIIIFILIFIFCGGLRLGKRVYAIIFRGDRLLQKRKTLVVGAGDAGEQLARNVFSSKSPYLLVGFVDDNVSKRGVMIHGLKVLGKVSDMPEVIKKHAIEILIIAIPSASSRLIGEAVRLGRESGIKDIKILPPVSEIINGKVKLSSLKEVEVGDLLGRKVIEIDTKEIASFIKGRIVLITGAAGSIGSELSKQVARFSPALLILLDQDETGIFNISEALKKELPDLVLRSLVGDIIETKNLKRMFIDLKPNVVFHAAAYKHVPLMEGQPDEAVRNNIFGLKNVAELSVENNVEKFIYISTDKAVNPTSVMGATKRVGEMICQALNQQNKTKFISVRFGNVLDSRGSVIPTFREQIKRGGPVEVTHPEMKRYFMLNSEACLLVMQAGFMGFGGEVFVLDMGGPIKILDLAREMIKLSGLEEDRDIAIVFTGVRPGEKLFEEMLTAEEGTVATKNKKIFIAKLSKIDQEELGKNLEGLDNILNKSEVDMIISKLKSFVPYFNTKA